MPEFLRLLVPSEAMRRWLAALPQPTNPKTETVATEQALGRVLACPVVAPHPLPPFRRGTVDGYAVRAADTYGASPSIPAYLSVVGEVPMGKAAMMDVGPGQALLVHTGGMLPPAANAVVMLEDTQKVSQDEIEVLKPVAPNENVIEAGEDVKQGETVVESGLVLRPQEIGGLMALGIGEVAVAQRPRVGIISSGDEIVDPRSEASLGQIRDVNTYSLSALIEEAGGEALRYGIVADDREALEVILRRARAESDGIVVSAGSSVSARDITAEAIRNLGEPGILVHGVSIKPGKPTILGVADGIPVLGLPGNPVSALVVAMVFLVPVIHRLLGLRFRRPDAVVTARLTVNLPSEAGREDFVPVLLSRAADGWLAEPVYGRSNLIFTLVRADGLVRIPPDATGLSTGSLVDVRLF